MQCPVLGHSRARALVARLPAGGEVSTRSQGSSVPSAPLRPYAPPSGSRGAVVGGLAMTLRVLKLLQKPARVRQVLRDLRLLHARFEGLLPSAKLVFYFLPAWRGLLFAPPGASSAELLDYFRQSRGPCW